MVTLHERELRRWFVRRIIKFQGCKSNQNQISTFFLISQIKVSVCRDKFLWVKLLYEFVCPSLIHYTLIYFRVELVFWNEERKLSRNIFHLLALKDLEFNISAVTSAELSIAKVKVNPLWKETFIITFILEVWCERSREKLVHNFHENA